jgi:hypothetical protein
MVNHRQLLRPDLVELHEVEEAKQRGFLSHIGKILKERCQKGALTVRMKPEGRNSRGSRPQFLSQKLKGHSNSIADARSFRAKGSTNNPVSLDVPDAGKEQHPGNCNPDVKPTIDPISYVDDLPDHPLPWSREEFSLVSAALREGRSSQVDVGSSSRKEKPLDLSTTHRSTG